MVKYRIRPYWGMYDYKLERKCLFFWRTVGKSDCYYELKDRVETVGGFLVEE